MSFLRAVYMTSLSVLFREIMCLRLPTLTIIVTTIMVQKSSIMLLCPKANQVSIASKTVAYTWPM